jgi:hypothetical protein
MEKCVEEEQYDECIKKAGKIWYKMNIHAMT